MNLSSRLESLIIPVVEELGFELVRLETKGVKHKTLEVMIERKDEQPVRMADCVRVSKELSVLLDVDDPFESSYLLEVTSPGIDRPLTKLKDYKRFKGHRIKIQTQSPIADRKRFKGLLLDVTGDKIMVDLSESEDEDGDVVQFSFNEIQSAKLIPDMENYKH